MATKDLGIILHGATGRICSTQHLHNALAPIIKEGGLPVGDDVVMPRLLLVGRNEERLAEIARANNVGDWTTDLGAALADPRYPVFFEAAATHQRLATLGRAIAAGKHIYSEKPVAPTVAEGLALMRDIEASGLKHGAVEDKIYLPGFQKLAHLIETGFIGPHCQFPNRVRLVGLRRDDCRIATAELELQTIGWRRTALRHAPTLALCDREHRWTDPPDRQHGLDRPARADRRGR